MKTAREANLMFEELTKNNYQPLLRKVIVEGKEVSMKLIECHIWRLNLKR